LRDYPEIASLYELYTTCRQQQVVVYQQNKGKDKTVQVVASYTTGYSVLPDEGGVLDQPHRIMAFFDAFMFGDRNGFNSS
jgi:hypothetical protein